MPPSHALFFFMRAGVSSLFRCSRAASVSKDTFCTDETVRRRRTLDELSAHKREGLWGNSSVPEPVLAAEQEAVGKYSSAIRPGAERRRKRLKGIRNRAMARCCRAYIHMCMYGVRSRLRIASSTSEGLVNKSGKRERGRGK